MALSESSEKFINHVIKKFLHHGISFDFSHTERVTDYEYDDQSLSGYYEPAAPKKTMCIGYKKPEKEWISVLAHEYCHFLQDMKKTPLWVASIKKLSRIGDSAETFFGWLAGRRISKDIAYKSFELSLAVELECEKMTIKCIKDFGLPIRNYEISANAYLFLYAYAIKHRKWSNTKPPYEVKRILNIMPDTFLDLENYYTMPKEYERLVTKYCL